MSEIDFKIVESKKKESIFEKEIGLLEEEGGVLLGAIQVLEDYLDYKKKNSRVDTDDINELKEMIMKFLRILSLIDVYRYFDSKNETISNTESFLLMVENDYSIRMNKFLNDFKNDFFILDC